MRVFSCILLWVLCLVPRVSAVEAQPEEHRFDFLPGGAVRVNLFAGAIRIVPTDASAVRVVVYKTPAATAPEAAQRWLEQIEVVVRQTDGGLTIEARDRAPFVRFTLGDRAEGDLRFEIFVPHHCRLDLETGRGRIDVGPELVGDVRARVESGNIALGRIEGRVDARIEMGEIQLSRATGDVTLQASRGSLTVGTVFGRAELQTSSGDIEILSARGGLEARATAGDVKAGFGQVLPAASSIAVSGGNLTVTVDPAVDLTLDASSFLGRVVARGVPIVSKAGGTGRRRLAGPLNAGGPLLKLHANGGHVLLVGEPEQLAGF